MAKSKKIIIHDMKEEFSPYEFEGYLSQLAEFLQVKMKQYGPKAHVSWNSDYWARYADSPSPRFEIYVDREETDEEFELRTSKVKKELALLEARERAEFERLQKKFNK